MSIENPFKKIEASGAGRSEKKELLKLQLKKMIESIQSFRKTVESVEKKMDAVQVDSLLDRSQRKIMAQLPPDSQRKYVSLTELNAQRKKKYSALDSYYANGVETHTESELESGSWSELPPEAQEGIASELYEEVVDIEDEINILLDDPYVHMQQQIAIMIDSLKQKFRIRQILEEKKDDLTQFAAEVNAQLNRPKNTDVLMDNRGEDDDLLADSVEVLNAENIDHVEFQPFEAIVFTRKNISLPGIEFSHGLHFDRTPITIIQNTTNKEKTMYHEHVHVLTLPGISSDHGITVKHALKMLTEFEDVRSNPQGLLDMDLLKEMRLANILEHFTPKNIINQQHAEIVAQIQNSQTVDTIEKSISQELLLRILSGALPQGKPKFARFGTAEFFIRTDIDSLRAASKRFESVEMRDLLTAKAKATEELFERIVKNIDTAYLVANALPRKKQNQKTIETAAIALLPTQYNHLKYVLSNEHGELAEEMWELASLLLEPKGLKWLVNIEQVTRNIDGSKEKQKMLREVLRSHIATMNGIRATMSAPNTEPLTSEESTQYIDLIKILCERFGIVYNKRLHENLMHAKRVESIRNQIILRTKLKSS